MERTVAFKNLNMMLNYIPKHGICYLMNNLGSIEQQKAWQRRLILPKQKETNLEKKGSEYINYL